MNRGLVAIDPATKPVVAALLPSGHVTFWSEPRGAVGLAEKLRSLFPEPPSRVIMEQPQYYFEGDSIQSALRFAEATGVIKGMLLTLGWGGITSMVTPYTWMTALDPAMQHPTGRGSYTARKRYFDALAESLFRGQLDTRVRRSEGDALCLLHYARTNFEQDGVSPVKPK